MPYNGYSEEYLDRLDNGNLPVDNKSYNKRKQTNSRSHYQQLIREKKWIFLSQRDQRLIYRPGTRASSCFEHKFNEKRRRSEAQQNKTIVTVDWGNSSQVCPGTKNLEGCKKFSNYLEFSQAEM
jgi:hypothetical protein